MSFRTTVPVKVTIDEVTGTTRYEFTLANAQGNLEHSFIADIPVDSKQDAVDVWMVNSTVAVGDTPADGFATFTPNLNDNVCKACSQYIVADGTVWVDAMQETSCPGSALGHLPRF